MAPGGPLEGPEVDRACGTCEPHVDRWEAGTEIPTLRQVELLAELTGFAVAWFYADPMPTHDPGALFVCGPGQIEPWRAELDRWEAIAERADRPGRAPGSWSPVPRRRPEQAPRPVVRRGSCERCGRPAPDLDVRCVCHYRATPGG
jgi:hypothetical protein